MRQITFDDGFTTESAPAQGTLQASKLQVYANDAAYVTAKGSAASQGDVYENSTLDVVRHHNGSAWVTMQDNPLLLEEIATPANPAANSWKVYVKSDGNIYKLSSAGTESLVGAGGGGGGGGAWCSAPGTAPAEDVENGEKVFLFSVDDRGTQKTTLFVKVPQSYAPGTQILMFLGQYSPATSGTQLFTATTSLVRKNQDAVGSTTNQETSTNTALTNTVANQYRQSQLDLTDSDGEINAVAVTAGDLLRVDLMRGTDTDVEDIRLVPSATEVKFS